MGSSLRTSYIAEKLNKWLRNVANGIIKAPHDVEYEVSQLIARRFGALDRKGMQDDS